MMTATLIVLGLTAVYALYLHLSRLRRRNHQLETLISHAPVSMFWSDRDGKIIGANDRFLQMCGCGPASLKGQYWYAKLLPDESALRVRHALRSTTEKVMTFEAPLVDIRGEIKPMKWTAGQDERYWIFVLRS